MRPRRRIGRIGRSDFCQRFVTRSGAVIALLRPRPVGPARESGEAGRKDVDACSVGGSVQAPVPSRERQLARRENKRGREVERVEASQVMLEGECRRVLYELLVDLYDANRGPLLSE
jgi:hypothetical protein